MQIISDMTRYGQLEIDILRCLGLTTNCGCDEEVSHRERIVRGKWPETSGIV